MTSMLTLTIDAAERMCRGIPNFWAKFGNLHSYHINSESYWAAYNSACDLQSGKSRLDHARTVVENPLT